MAGNIHEHSKKILLHSLDSKIPSGVVRNVENTMYLSSCMRQTQDMVHVVLQGPIAVYKESCGAIDVKKRGMGIKHAGDIICEFSHGEHSTVETKVRYWKNLYDEGVGKILSMSEKDFFSFFSAHPQLIASCMELFLDEHKTLQEQEVRLQQYHMNKSDIHLLSGLVEFAFGLETYNDYKVTVSSLAEYAGYMKETYSRKITELSELGVFRREKSSSFGNMEINWEKVQQHFMSAFTPKVSQKLMTLVKRQKQGSVFSRKQISKQ